MNNFSELLKYYKSPAFLLKNEIIIAYNKKFEELFPDIKKNKEIGILLNTKVFNFDEKIKTTTFTIKKDNQKLELTLHPFNEKIADFLITAELLEDPKNIEEKEIKLQNIFRLGYVIFDLDKNYTINNINFPNIFVEKMGIKDSLNFFNNYTSKDSRQRFQKEIILAFKNQKPYFNYNTKIDYSKTEVGRIQMRCFPVSNKGKNQLFCTVIEYSSIKNLISKLTEAESSFFELFQNNIDPILIVDDEKIIRYNYSAKNKAQSVGIDLQKNTKINDLFLSEKNQESLTNKLNYKERIQIKNKLPNGKEINFELKKIPIFYNQKSCNAIILKDTTEEQNLIKELTNSKKKYEEILDSAFDGIVLTDDLIIEFWNKSAEKITGLSKAEVIGMSIFKIFEISKNSENFHELIDNVNLDNKTKKNSTLIKKIITKDNKEIILNISITVFTDSKGIRKAVGIFNDITEKHNANEEILRKKEEVNKINTSLKNFFSILAHDMRSPVIQMMSLSDLLIENFDSFSDIDKLKYLQMLYLASKNGLELLDTIVEWGRAMTNKIIIHPENFEIDTIIRKAIRMNDSQATSKNISIYLIPNSLSVYADSNMIFTILNNLISNAVKFSYKDSRVIIKTTLEKNHVKISVKDTGIGIKDKNSIFLYNKKNISLGTENEKGKGIGLMFTAELVKKNNGKIWVESELKKGSTFYFTIPKAKDTITTN